MKDGLSEQSYVRRMFNDMADEYDDVRDVWYEFLFRSLDEIIDENFRGRIQGKRVLDVGCGTGQQSITFGRLGAEVIGFDIADKLVKLADKRLINAETSAEFVIADAIHIPFGDETFDVVSCCGSTLSFIADFAKATDEMARVLRPDGHILLDAEQKWNLDMFWEALSSVGGDFLGYGTSVHQAVSHFSQPWNRGYYLDYPFRKLSGETAVMRIRLFSNGELRKLLLSSGITPLRQYAIHALTNVVPSTVLHSPTPSRLSRAVFRGLAAVEKSLRALPPVRGLGNTVVFLGRKDAP